MSVHWEVGDVCVQLERRTETGVPRVRARYPVRGGPRFRVYPAGMSPTDDGEWLALFPSGADVDDRDFEFVTSHRVTTMDDSADVERVLTTHWRRHIVQWARNARIISDRSIVEGIVPWMATDDRQLAPLVDLVVGLASADIFGLSPLRQLPDAQYQPATGSWQQREAPRAIVNIPARVTITPIPYRSRAATRLELHQPVELGLRKATTHDALPKPLADYGITAAAWRALGDGALEVRNHTVRFTWTRVVTDTPLLMAGVELMRAFIKGPAFGAYR